MKSLIKLSYPFIIFRISLKIISKIKSFLSNNFKMNDLDEGDVILEKKLIKSPKRIAFSLPHSIKKLIEKFGFLLRNIYPLYMIQVSTLKKLK